MSKNSLSTILSRLSAGNEKFVDDSNYEEQREYTEDKQNPCFVVVSCSDSRVSVPIIFDQPSIGRFFEVKTAGQALASSDIESIKYALQNFGDSLKIVIVLGHTNCGAVIAAVESTFDTKEALQIRKAYPTIIRNIVPSVLKVKGEEEKLRKNTLIRRSEIQNAIDTAQEIQFLLDGKVPVVPAIYNISTGMVNWLIQDD